MIYLNNSYKIVCIGDSLTFGYSIPQKESWTYLLKEDLKLNLINKGINGDTSIGLLSRFFKDVLTNKPQICIIMCGTNDILSNRSVNSIIDNINIMIKDCLFNNIIPIILSPPKTFKSLAQKLWNNSINYIKINNNLNLLNKELEKLCILNNIYFLDIYNLIKEESIYFNDGIHLSKYGNYLMFNEIKNLLITNFPYK